MHNIDPPHNASQYLYPSRLEWVGPSFDSALNSSSQVLSVLDEGVRSCCIATQNRSQDDINRAIALYHNANALVGRFEETGMVSDIDEAIRCYREALSLLCGRGDQSTLLNDLASCLYARFKRLGVLSDLQDAIDLHSQTLELRQPGHGGRSATLYNLALCFSSQFDQRGVKSDLEEAIQFLSQALGLLQPDDFRRSLVLVNLGDCFYTLFEHTGDVSSLDKAMNFHQEALPQLGDNPVVSSSGNLLALFKQASENRNNLARAIELNRHTISSCQPGHSILPKSLHNLAECYFARFDLIGDSSDLDLAINYHHKALKLRPFGHPDRSSSLSSLAKCLLTRSKHSVRSPRIDHDEGAFRLYSKLMDVSQAEYAVFVQDVLAAKDWICVAEEMNHHTTVSAYCTLFKLLVYHLAALPALTQHYPLLKKLPSSLAMDAFSACLRHGHLVHAIQLFEQGRDVFVGLLSNLRSSLDNVEAFGDRGKELMKKFRELVSSLHNASKHDKLSAQLQGVVFTIRGLPGLQDFLLPPSYLDLMQAVSGGPIIILNASQYGCDALILLPSQDPTTNPPYPPHVPLRITLEGVRNLVSRVRSSARRIMAADVTQDLGCLLHELWDDVVSPIVDVLQNLHPFGSRIWWYPTGEFSMLPFHAAGPYQEGQKNLPDLYISSYSPTLTSLIRARRRNPWCSTAERKQFLLVGQPCEAVNQSEFHFVNEELDHIRRRVGDQVATFTRLDGEQSCTPRVIEELERNEWVHFAWPAQPFGFVFALHDMIQQITKCHLRNPEFAYLSACQTVAGDTPGKMIRLASLMQFVGFRSVIGTMWAVDDAKSAQIASTFYSHMLDDAGRLDHTRAVLALNRTINSANVPLNQRVLYMHFGV